MNPTHNQYVFVTGAGGFIGKPVIAHLLARGWNVKAMVRKTSPSPFPPHAALQTVYADLRDAPALRAALQGACVVVHLAAAKADEKWSADVNVGGAVRLVEACKKVGCTRVINISSQSVKILRKGIYAKTKLEADRIFENSGLQVTTLLPSVVYGEEKSGVFGTVLQFVTRLPFVPVLGDGKWVSAPIYVGDVAETICRCIERDNTIGKKYDLGGPNQITFDEFIDRISTELAVRRPKLHIPFGAALLAARMVVWLLPKPPVTVSNVLGSNQNTKIDIVPARRDFDFAPLDFAAGLKMVLTNDANASMTDASALGAKPVVQEEELAQESLVFSRYLIGREPSKEMVGRYIKANRVLARELMPSATEPELQFVRRHPSALPFIDAAAGLLRSDSLLRKKLLVMVAILEASPDHADCFLGETDRPFILFCKLFWQGIRAAVKITLGVPVFWVAQKR